MTLHIVQPEFVKAPLPPPPGRLKRFGRVAAVDERSFYPRRAMAAPATDNTFISYLSPARTNWPAVLDQGYTSECCAYAGNKALLTHRVVNVPLQDCNTLYKKAQSLDEWDGDKYDGTSINGTCKALREFGYVTGWTWTKEVEALSRHMLAGLGPILFGLDWTEDMMEPDRHGYIHPTGDIAGGHAVLGLVRNKTRPNPDGTTGATQILNSWGLEGEWGRTKGRAWITDRDLQKLLDGLAGWPGEAAAFVEVKK